MKPNGGLRKSQTHPFSSSRHLIQHQNPTPARELCLFKRFFWLNVVQFLTNMGAFFWTTLAIKGAWKKQLSP
jgi:hypothetical protein